MQVAKPGIQKLGNPGLRVAGIVLIYSASMCSLGDTS